MQQKRAYEEAKDSQTIDCRTAEGDIRVLEGEKAHVAQRIAEGATSIVPAGIAIGLLTRTEGTKVRVATGEYNKALDRRIADIKQTCQIL
jgi:hypothetical protein